MQPGVLLVGVIPGFSRNCGSIVWKLVQGFVAKWKIRWPGLGSGRSTST